ncbi:hypothetical protein ACFFQF_18655 [Haladaptatus pallidirubidus]
MNLLEDFCQRITELVEKPLSFVCTRNLGSPIAPDDEYAVNGR